MAKKYLQIQISTPCSEDFSKMTSVEKGHFCSNCEKVVIDFSKMSDQEVANFYKKNGGDICGSFHPSQLNRDIRLAQPKVNSIFGKAAGLILTGVLSAGVTNVAAQSLEVTPPFSVVDSEHKNEEEKKESIKEKVIRINLVGENIFDKNESGKGIEGAIVTHQETKITATSDSSGVAEIRIPESYFKKIKLIFEVDHPLYKKEKVRLYTEKIKESSLFEFKLESDFSRMIYGGPSFIESESPYYILHPHDPSIIKNEKVKDFDFEKSDFDENIDSIKPLNSEELNPSEEEDSIIPPLGVAIKKVYPNPFIDRINIEVYTERKGNIQINLIDISGRIVFQKVEKTEKGTQQFQIEVGNLSLSGNMYILQVQDENGNTQSQQLMRFTNHGFTMR